MKNFYEATKQDPLLALPLTYHIKNIDDSEYVKFKQFY